MLTKRIFFFSIFFLCSQISFIHAEDDLDEVIVIGSRLQLQNQQLGNSMTSLTTEDIQNIGSPYIADVLRHVPGLSVSRTGPTGGLTQVRIRGSESNHTLVIIDGIEANSVNGEYDFSALSSDNIERIEVLRGAQSGVYGSNATAGVINIVTRRTAEEVAVNIAIETGTLGLERQAFSVQGGNKVAQGSFSINHQKMAFNASEFGNEDDQDENTSAYAKGQWQLSNQIEAFFVGRFLDKASDLDNQDFSGGPNQGLALDTVGFSDTEEKLYLVGVNFSLLNGAWKNTASYDQGEFDNKGSSFSNTIANFGSSGSREKLLLVSNYYFEAREGVEQRGSFFMENEKETYRNTFPFDPSQIAEQSRRLNSLGLEYFVNWNRQLYLSFAWRSDDNDNFEDANTYRVSSRWLMDDDSNIHGTLGIGITNPSFFEQFGFIPGSYMGNPNLEPEQQQSWDLGWEKNWLNGQLRTDVTYFDSALTNEIAGFTTPFNLSTESERNGFEISFLWQRENGFSLNGSYTHSDAMEIDVQETRRPEQMAALDVAMPLLNNKLNLQLGLVYNGDMIDNDFRTFTRSSVEAYTLVNVSARYRFSERIEGFVRANNLFDEDYQEIIGFATPGIHGSAGLNISL